MNRLCVLLAVIVVMIGALFSVQEALAKVITGTAGEDTLVRTDGDDRIKGLRGADRFTGRDGNDRLKGSRGNDRLKGSRGNDRIWSSRGNNKIVPGEDDDTVYAGHGDDLIYARDVGGKDYIDCGPGFDKVETIHSDDITLGNCERAPGPDLGQI